MRLAVSSFAEHKTAGFQRVIPILGPGLTLLAPGASSSCVGCSSCSSAAASAIDRHSANPTVVAI